MNYSHYHFFYFFLFLFVFNYYSYFFNNTILDKNTNLNNSDNFNEVLPVNNSILNNADDTNEVNEIVDRYVMCLQFFSFENMNYSHYQFFFILSFLISFSITTVNILLFLIIKMIQMKSLTGTLYVYNFFHSIK